MIKKTFLLSILSFTVLISSGCSGLYSKGSIKADPEQISQASEFKQTKKYAQLYIAREGRLLAGALPLEIYIENEGTSEKIGTLGNFDEYFHIKFTPGNYTIKAKIVKLNKFIDYPYSAVAGALDIIFCDLPDYYNEEDCQIRKITSKDKAELSEYTLNSSYKAVFGPAPKQLGDNYYAAFRQAEVAGSIKAYKDFLKKHPKGMYTTTAKRRINKLK